VCCCNGLLLLLLLPFPFGLLLLFQLLLVRHVR
jgi:hypothetical protein